ncbi:hypothetical protein [Robertkochia aurantiaca]|uniref:hypothetical protein n=1 Tax=Robertkochia aurantiaca TaxID=2873700 RepID=UPI001CCC5FF5|nr:hypothetical protein [Robertkochia sp. 3YJGBD-33]
MYARMLCIALVMLIFNVFFSSAQTVKDSTLTDQQRYQLEQLRIERDNIVAEEKDRLKAEVSRIDARLEKGEISDAEAKRLKEEAAMRSARNIENKTAIIENKIALLERGETYEFEVHKGTKVGMDDDDCDSCVFGVDWDDWDDWDFWEHKERRYDRRTYSDLVIAFGFNNAIFSGESFNDTPYKIGGSRFFEIGWQWKTRVFKNSNWLRVSYGFSIQQNGLKPDDNQYFVKDGDLTTLETFDLDLNKSKLRMDNIVIPVYFEFGPSKKIEREDYFRYSTHDQFRMGLGGYVGLNYTTRQKLKYRENGERVKEKIIDNYNTNNTIYGLAGYVGFGDVSLYVKYDLNTIFKDQNTEQRNISAGLRFEL